MYCRAKKLRHQIPTLPAHEDNALDGVVLNPAYRIDTDDRARTGSVIVTNPADQIQYLIPMVEQAPGEYMEAVARNQDYTYAPPMQPPAEYATIDEGGDVGDVGDVPNEEALIGGRDGKRQAAPGRNVDPNGYVVDASSAPVEPSDGEGARNVDPDGYVVDGSDGLDGSTTRNIVYSSYAEGSTGGATNAAEYGTPTEYGEGVYAGAVDGNLSIANTAIYGDDMHADDPSADSSHSVA
jgi:hypothetical protein